MQSMQHMTDHLSQIPSSDCDAYAVLASMHSMFKHRQKAHYQQNTLQLSVVELVAVYSQKLKLSRAT